MKKGNEEKVEAFIKKHPKFFVASAYETDTTILLSTKPKAIKIWKAGSGFNYGSTTILGPCPEAILILAEND